MKSIVVSLAIGMIVGALLMKKYSAPSIIEKTITKDHVVTVIRRTKNKDGSSQTDTTRTEDRNQVRTESKQPEYMISAGILGAGYQVSAQRRLFGPVWLGANASTQGMLGLTVGIEF